MVNFNGDLLPKNGHFINHDNRGLRYGDALFETIRVVNGKISFLEGHYLRLMSSMRILRMEIPMNFTMEFIAEQIVKTINANNFQEKPARVRLTIFRNNGGLYLPMTNEITFIIEAQELQSSFYIIENQNYEVELFKAFFVNPDMLSTLKTNNKIINVIGSIFSKENDYDNCLLLNIDKNVVEALNGNIFLVKGNLIKTPPLKDGCLNGIIRNKIIGIIKKIDGLTILEDSISPFELQKADELFITNSILGIQPITNYRKKEFASVTSKNLLGKLNAVARLELT